MRYYYSFSHHTHTHARARAHTHTGALRRRTIKFTDARIQLMSEIINAIKLIKLYAWETAFADKVNGGGGVVVVVLLLLWS